MNLEKKKKLAESYENLASNKILNLIKTRNPPRSRPGLRVGEGRETKGGDEGAADCRDATLITSASIKKKRIKEKNEVGLLVTAS